MYDTRIIKQNPNGNIVEQLQDWMWLIEDAGNMWYVTIDWVEFHSKLWFEYWQGPMDVCVQAGGAFGVYPRMLAEQFARVYTFEPTPSSFHCLTNNCQKKNIIKFQSALGDKGNFIPMLHYPHDSALNHFTLDESVPVKVQQITIDSLELKACNLIALDIESYELQALKGAEQTIKRFWPRIITENGGLVTDWLEPLGYHIQGMSSGDTIWVH